MLSKFALPGVSSSDYVGVIDFHKKVEIEQNCSKNKHNLCISGFVVHNNGSGLRKCCFGLYDLYNPIDSYRLGYLKLLSGIIGCFYGSTSWSYFLSPIICCCCAPMVACGTET